MDRTAIEAITELATARTDEAGEYAILNGNQKIESLERFGDIPWRFRGTFKTAVLAEFIAYLNKNADSESGLYIDHLEGSAQAIIDQGGQIEPHWGAHRANLDLLESPEYKEVLRLSGVCLAQQAFIDFVEDYPECFTFFDDGLAPITDTKATLAKLRRLKVDSNKSSETAVGNFAHHASTMEQVEIKAAGNEAPPAGFDFKFIPYDGFDFYTLRCQLRAISDGDNVALKYRILALEATKKDIAADLLDKIKTGTQGIEGLQIYIGSMAYQP